MSIADELHKLECKGLLHRFTPKSRRVAKRRLYMTSQAFKDFGNPASAVNILVGEGFIRSAFTHWTLGDRIYASKPGKTGGFLKELDPPPDDVWEIRVTAPTPQARLFGTFAEPDTMIITHLHTRSYLGPKGSANWMKAMNDSATSVAALSTIKPYRANHISNYVTENCDEFPLKR